MKRNRRRRCGTQLEQLEARTVFAVVSGSVWIDLDGDGQAGAGDEAARSALVWVDTNRNGLADAGEPQTRSDADGKYAFTGLAAGDYEIRMQPTPGLFQTSPAQYFTFQRDSDANRFGLAEIDVESGSVTPLTPNVGDIQFGLIKTVQGVFYGAGHVDDSLYRIDPVTGEQALIGDTGKDLVGGLAYDPVMDKIYTLASEKNDNSVHLLLYEVDRQTGGLTRVGTGDGMAGIFGPSALTFDLVHREVALFDNSVDQLVAFNLDGDARKVSQFASGVGFYNLAFDGHRFLTLFANNQFTSLYEVDVSLAALTPVRTLDRTVWGEAADILAVNAPNRVHLESGAAEQAELDFLTNGMNITQGRLQIDGSSFHLSSPESRLELRAPLGDGALPLRFCVGAQASELTIEQSLGADRPIEIQMSPLDDRLSIDALPRIAIQMGSGRDTLVPLGPMQWTLSELASNVSGVDVIDLSANTAVTLVSDADSIRALSDSNKLTVIASSEDSVDMNQEPWVALAPVADGQRRLHELSIDDVILELDDGLGWHNPLDALDVSRDGLVSPLDALLVINLLNSAGSRSLNAADSLVAQVKYVDSSGDNFVSPIDALLVINELNRRG